MKQLTDKQKKALVRGRIFWELKCARFNMRNFITSEYLTMMTPNERELCFSIRNLIKEFEENYHNNTRTAFGFKQKNHKIDDII